MAELFCWWVLNFFDSSLVSYLVTFEVYGLRLLPVAISEITGKVELCAALGEVEELRRPRIFVGSLEFEGDLAGGAACGMFLMELWLDIWDLSLSMLDLAFSTLLFADLRID